MDAQRAYYGMTIEPSHQEPTKTLRDEFAIAVLAGSCTHTGGWDSFEKMAEVAYEVADAMLAARKKES